MENIDFYKVLFEDLDPERLRKNFLKLLLQHQNVDRGSMWIKKKDRYVCVESLGGPKKIDIIKGFSISIEQQSIVGWVMTHGEMTIAETGKDQRHFNAFEKNMSLKSSLILAFPLVFRNGEVYGVVQIVDTSAGGRQMNLDRQYLRLLKGIVDIGAIALDNAMQYAGQVRRTNELEKTLGEFRSKVHIIGQSAAFLEAMKKVRDYARTDFPVLITGESGTGKDLVASALHDLSYRKDKPFVVQNCSAIPETLLESELFGYKKGAFTGATEDKTGLLMAADGGTVFMDEIGDMPIQLQARILRVIQNNEIKPLGDTRTRKINVRIISATNQDLDEAILQKRFREDLFYRINVLPLNLPPLRERRKDIPLLLNYFIRKESLGLNIHQKQISRQALKTLQEYHWQGNIRELENFVKYMLSTVDGNVIDLEDIPDHLKPDGAAPLPLSNQAPNITGRPVEETLLDHVGQALPIKTEPPLADYTWNKLEKEYIMQLLLKNNWVVSNAARDAGMNRSTFDSKMKKLGIRK